MLGWIEATGQIAMANSVRWCGHVLTMEDGHVLRSALRLKVTGRKGG